MLLALGLCLAAGAVVAQGAPVYKWKDAGGVTHYGSQPPDGANYEVTSIRAKRTSKQALQTRVSKQSDLREAEKVRKDFAAEEAATEEQARKETEEQRAANCQKARDQLETYDTSPRLYRPLPNGEREYLNDEELDAERANARRQVREWCD
jgi:hypothetical protein